MFNRNMRLRLLRSNEEGLMLHHIKSYAARCQTLYDEILKPYSDLRQDADSNSTLNPQFVDAMLRIVPYIRQHQGEPFSLRDLITLTELKPKRFYEIIASDLESNPRQLIRLLRLDEARQLLSDTALSVSEIANRCGFVSPNYFIALFYHQYRVTPQHYRNKMPR